MVPLRGGPAATPTYTGNAHAAPIPLLTAHPVCESPGRDLCHSSLNRNHPRCHWPSPTGAPSSRTSRKWGHPTRPYIGKLTPPSVNNRRTQLVILSGVTPSTPTYTGNAHVDSGHLTGNQLGVSPRTAFFHCSLHGHAQAASVRLLPAHRGGTSPRNGSCHASLRRQHPCRLQPSPNRPPKWWIFREGAPATHSHICMIAPSPTGAPSKCISRYGPCFTPFNRHVCISSRHLLTGNYSWFLYGEGPLPHQPTPAMLTPPPSLS